MNEAKDKEGRELGQHIKLKLDEKELAYSQQWRDMLLLEMKTSTSDVMKSEIQSLLKWPEEEIRKWKEWISKYESDANSREKRLVRLKKEGGVRDVKRKIESGEETELKVMNKFGLERVDLNFRCPSTILNSIAELKSTPHNHSHSSTKQKAAAMLAKEKGSEATCLKLAEALHKCKKISILEKFCEEVKPEVEKRCDMTTLPAQLERDLSLKKQKTTTSDDIKSEKHRRLEKAKGMIPPQNTATSLDQPVTQHHTRVKLMSSESNAETPQQSAAFQEARIKAKIPFLHHQVLECDSSGQEFNIIKHDLTVEIPKGCVSEGEKLCLEVGVAMYGPFKFTDDSQPISPILWLCFLNEDVKVNKPIKITVPHFLTGLTESRLQEHRVSFAKANHLNHSPQEDFIMYNFEPSEDKTQFISRNDKSYGVLETTHCCYLCMIAHNTPLLAKDATCCLTIVERITSRGIEIHFAATFLLDTCIEALKNQYPIEDGYRIALRKIFKFMNSEAVPLKITVPEDDDKYIIQKAPHSLEILASQIDFWSKQFNDMLLEDKLHIYPPRVIMEVILKTNDPLTIVMKFSGSLDDRQLDVELAFPLGHVKAENRKRENDSTPEETVRKAPKVVKSGPIKDPDCLFEEMAKDIDNKYGGVGIDLGVAYQTLLNELETVQFNMSPANEKAFKMLQIWKYSVAEEDLTYSKLAAALEKNGLKRCADKYCYTTATTSHNQPVSTVSGVCSFQHNAPQNTATSLDQPASTLTQQHTTGDVSEQMAPTLTPTPSLAPSGEGRLSDRDHRDIYDKLELAPQNTATSLDQPVTQHHTRVKLMSSESKTETPQQSAAFKEARTRAKIPFLHHQVLECTCDSNGGEFNIMKHDITVEIPEGCVSEGEKLCLEVGVAMYGPFKFTDDSQPISPILWLCFLNEDVKVNKPIKIIVPHCLTGLIESRLREHQVSFAKANHNDYIPQKDFIMYNFEPSKDKTQFISRNDKSYGVLETSHCCFLCIKAKRTPLLAQDATYCLTRVERITSRGFEINFTATYLLDTCIEVLKKQYPSEDGYRIALPKIFKFMNSEAVPLQITVPEDDDKYLVGKAPLEPEIFASQIDFWGELRDKLLEEKVPIYIYNPQVEMEVILKTHDPFTIVMKFRGSQNDRQLNVQLAFPLGDVKAGNRKSGSESKSEETVRKIPKVVKPGPIKDPDCLFKDMAKVIGDKYKNVGIDLGVAYQILQNELETGQFKMRPANEKTMKMLQIWRNSVVKEDFTYSTLAAALEKNGLIRCADDHCYTEQQ